MHKLKQGFTLIELLVVVAIIAILALIVLLAINPVEMARRSRDSRRMSDIGTMRRAIDLSLADGGVLQGDPVTHYTATTADGGNVLVADDANNLAGLKIGKYLSVIPQDPMYKAGDATTLQTITGVCPSGSVNTVAKQQMVYTFASDGSTYELTAHLESTDNCAVPSGDGGNSDILYELGTTPGLTF